MEWMSEKLKGEREREKQKAEARKSVSTRQDDAEWEHRRRQAKLRPSPRPPSTPSLKYLEKKGAKRSETAEIKDLQTYSAKMEKITKMFHNEEDRDRRGRIRQGLPEYSTIKEEEL